MLLAAPPSTLAHRFLRVTLGSSISAAPRALRCPASCRRVSGGDRRCPFILNWWFPQLHQRARTWRRGADMTHLSNFLTGAGGGGALMGQLNPTNSASRSRAVKNYIPQQGPGICLEKKCHVHSDFPTKVSTETCRHALQLHTSPPGLNSEGREMLFNLVDFFFREYHSFIEYA